jgi:hypothetical protein
LIFPASAYSRQKKKATEETSWKVAVETSKKLTSNDWLNVKIIHTERDIIRKYFQDNTQANLKRHKVTKSKRLPPGLQKKVATGCDLPPGWQKKIARSEVLDVRVYRQAVRLPVELCRRLPPAPEGTVLIKVEGKVIRLYEATRTIIDVFDIDT